MPSGRSQVTTTLRPLSASRAGVVSSCSPLRVTPPLPPPLLLRGR